MKILITGQSGLAKALSEVYSDHDVFCASRTNGHDISQVDHWGSKFLDHDMVINSAYDGIGQIKILEFFYAHWKNHIAKHIINIGSRIINFPRSDGDNNYLPYQVHKSMLQKTFELMLVNAKCDLKLINPGPFDTAMVSHLSVPKMDPRDLSQRIKTLAEDPWIKRVDLWL